MLSILKRPRFGSFVALAMAFSAAGAPAAGAMAGGGGGGERPGRAIHTDAPRDDRSRPHMADRGGRRDPRRLDHLYGGAEDDPLYVGNAYGGGWREDSYRDHRWEGLYYR